MEDRTGFTLLETALLTEGIAKDTTPTDIVVGTIILIVGLAAIIFIWTV